ncbi:kelch-like protein 3 [Melanaphis sacchari]|uniref:Kelch-like protein diablo n=1 Tax=Melanaphis sacchari TaxID=742174 RepID=A0A2H8TYK2_9HEMI|nr:kelch-like protein 3 [Melanaphis sacchari]
MDREMETPEQKTPSKLENTPSKQKKIPSKSNRFSDEDDGIALTSKGIMYIGEKEPYSNSMRLDESTMDISLVVNNQKLNAHKAVLSANSAYFNKMFDSDFKERFQDKIEITITDISFDILSSLVQFIYTSEIYITENNVQDLLISSSVLLLDEVENACVNYIKKIIDTENCINMKDFAKTLGLNDLYSLCMTYIINNFRAVANTKEFMETDFDEIMLLLKNENLFAKEDMVYDVVMNWIKYDPVTRSKYSSELLWYVRLPLVLNTYQGVIKNYGYHGSKRNELNSFRMEHRKPFRKGILVLSHYPFESTPEWYDAAIDQWQNCICENCLCKTFQYRLLPPRTLCTVVLLDKNRLFAAGGSRYGRGMKLADMYDLETNKWIPLIDMYFERLKPFIIQLESRVYVVGGCTSEKKNASVIEYYDLIEEMWHVVYCEINHIETFKNDSYVACVKGLIYIIGKTQAGYFNPRTKKWSYIDPIPEYNKGSAVCALNGNIYIIGGQYFENYYKSVWAYCTLTEEWVSLAELNFARSFSGAVAMNGNIYLFGGKMMNTSSSNIFEIYNPHDNKWVTSSAFMKKDRCHIDAIVIEKSSDFFIKVFEESSKTIY